MQAYTVTQLATYLRTTLERDPNVRSIWLTGEVTNHFMSAARHRYFAIKDADSQLKAVLFADKAGGEHLANGAQVNIHGYVSFYPARGEIQLYADAVMPAGEGLLAAEFERLRAMLEAEGLFEVSRKRPLPSFPRRIGVVTSAQGAVIHDMTTVLRSRYPLGELVFCAASVQGNEAPYEVADAIQTLNAQQDIDVIIIARGGGSLEDLWTFNTEEVARAIHASRAPIVSAVGHESDFTLADFAADVRAPTPSVAAAMVAPDVRELGGAVIELAARAHLAAANQLTHQTHQIESLIRRMQRCIPDIAIHRQRIDDTMERARTALGAFIRTRQEQTSGLQQTLAALNPTAVLERGFSIATNAQDGRIITASDDLAPGTTVRTILRHGRFESTVTKTDAS